MNEMNHETLETLGAVVESGRSLTTMQRRRFLQAALIAGAGTVVGVAGPSLLPSVAQAQSSSTDTILVTVTLGGGNDGLNTLGPFGNGNYRDLRGPVAINEGSAHSGPNGLSWHPSLRRLATRYRRGDVAVVDGLGNPTRDLSHFSCMATWQAGNAGNALPTGWLGRWLDTVNTGEFGGVSIGGRGVPLQLRANQTDVTDLPTSGGGALYGADRSDERDNTMYRAIDQMRNADASPWVNEVGLVNAQSIESARAVSGAFATDLPEASRVLTDLVLAARLINLNLGTRVLNVAQTGYDTHDNQVDSNSSEGTHADLLSDLDVALDSFFSTLNAQMAERVVVLVFSEFGRRAAANGSRGTDHGTSSKAFLIGRRVRGGLYGDTPSLRNLDDRGNFDVTVDFREMYSSVLRQVLGSESQQILGQSFQSVGELIGSVDDDVSSIDERVAKIQGRRRSNAEDYLLDRAPTF